MTPHTSNRSHHEAGGSTSMNNSSIVTRAESSEPDGDSEDEPMDLDREEVGVPQTADGKGQSRSGEGGSIDKPLARTLDLQDDIVDYIATASTYVLLMEADEATYLGDLRQITPGGESLSVLSTKDYAQDAVAALRIHAASWERWLRWSSTVSRRRREMIYVVATGRSILGDIERRRDHWVGKRYSDRNFGRCINRLVESVGAVWDLLLRSHFAVLHASAMSEICAAWKGKLDRALVPAGKHLSPAELLGAVEILLDWREVACLSVLFRERDWRRSRAATIQTCERRRFRLPRFNYGNPLGLPYPQELSGEWIDQPMLSNTTDKINVHGLI
ncbi:hypothetical protein FS749_016451 [Ceratobasidium sp. UAMH 11750]|nr:hypothetical protein FS749_016451 [Ceratobasidium sp. UAMH 11750]